jgi:hypothetical protein
VSKTVLIIGADFSPSSLPPATRIRFFATHLPEFGWRPTILTTDPKFYDWNVDPENDHLLPPSLEINRTDAFSSNWTRRLGVGDVGIRSLWQHWTRLKRICESQPIDLIFIPVPPYMSMVLGRLAHSRFGIPYVIDYIDPWVTGYYWKVPKSQRPPKWILADALSKVVEPFAIKHVSHITGVSSGTTNSVVERYAHLRSENATEIPYGASASDFEYVRLHPRPNPVFDCQDGLVHVSYVGACIPAMHESVRALFQAMRLGLNRSRENFGLIRLHFVGTTYAHAPNNSRPIEDLAREAGIEGYVDERPSRVSYLDSLQIMIDSHALFLAGSVEPHYTASKVFPCILSHRPVLAIFHEESSVVDILRETRAGKVFTFGARHKVSESVSEVADWLGDLGARSREQQFSVDGIELYSTREMARRLAGVFEQAIRIQQPEQDALLESTEVDQNRLQNERQTSFNSNSI